MSDEGEKKECSATVLDMLLALTVKELDSLMCGLVFDRALPAKDEKAHWHYYAFLANERKNEQRTLMVSLKSRYLSVKRVMYVLHYREDPVHQRHLEQLCGDESCVNPLHMRLIK